MVICQKDLSAIERSGGVSTKPPPSYHSNNSNSNSNSNYSNSKTRNRNRNRNRSSGDDSHESSSSKSCLVVPGFGKSYRSKNTLLSSSGASTTDQSSAAADVFNPRRNNDRQSLLKTANNNSNNAYGFPGTNDWYDDVTASDTNFTSSPKPSQFSSQYSGQSQFSSQSQFSQSQSQSQFSQQSSVFSQPPPANTTTNAARSMAAPSVTPSPDPPSASANSAANSNSIASPSSSLLQFPSPKDRSHDARRQVESRKGRKHAYQGELEPAGVRGQEAQILEPTNNINNNNSAPSFMPLRSFQTGGAVAAADISTTSSQELNSMMKQDFSPSPLRVNPNVSSAPPPTLSSSRRRVHPNNKNYNNQNNNISNHNRSISTTSNASTKSPNTPASQNQTSSTYNNSNSNNHVNHNNHVSHKAYGSESANAQIIPSFRRSAPVNVDDSSFEDPMENVKGIHAMAMEHVLRGEYDMALQAFSQVLQVYLSQYGRAHPLTASAYHNLGTVHSKRAGLLLDHTLHQRHCREQALLCFQAAARSARDAPQLGVNHPNVAVSLVRIGFLLLQSRQYQNAVITFEEALRIRSQHYGPTHALVANLYNNLGVCHMHLQEFVLGRRYLQQALDIQKQLLAQDEFGTTALLELADTLCNIGGLCLEWIRQQGPDARHALDAESAFLEALEVRTKVLGETHALTNQVRSLHDMVRSIPLPALSPTSQQHEQRSTSRSRPPSTRNRSRSPGRTRARSKPRSPTQSPGRPYAKGSPVASPSRSVSSPSSPHRGASQLRSTPRGLDLPDLPSNKNTRTKRDPPAKPAVLTASLTHNLPSNTTFQSGAVDKSAQSEISSLNTTILTKEDLLSYDATEENCWLGPLQDDGQLSTVVSYAQTTASWSTSTKKESERLAYLLQAKAILDAHQDFLDSPQVTLEKKKTREYPVVPKRQHNPVEEDGLAPLGGIWPVPIEDRITPEVLQDPAQHAKTIQACAASYMKRGRFGESLHLLEMVLEIQRTKNGPLHEDVGAALHNTGIAHLRMEHHYKALQAFEEAVRVRKGALGRDHPQVAVSLVKVGITLLLQKRLEDSLWIFREALTVRKHALGALHPSTARIYNNIGCVHVEFNELKEARMAFEAALDVQRNALVHDPESGPILFGAATTLQNLGYLYRKREMHEKAVMVLRESLGLQEQVLGPDHPTALSTLESLAEACALANRESQALKYYNEILERLDEQEDSTRVQHATVLYKMSKVHEQVKDIESQLNKLHVAVKVLRSDTMTREGQQLEHQIQVDMRAARQAMEKQELEWV